MKQFIVKYGNWAIDEIYKSNSPMKNELLKAVYDALHECEFNGLSIPETMEKITNAVKAATL